MPSPAVRLRVCVQERSDVGAIAQLLAPALGLTPTDVAARLTAGRLSIGPVQRYVAQELAEVLGGFGVLTRLEDDPTPAATRVPNAALVATASLVPEADQQLTG